MLDFGAFPPEITSTLMYSGPGPAPMMAAATAWDELAEKLTLFTTGYSSALSELQGEHWAGPASAAMTSAATPYAAWAAATAAQAEQTAGQIRAAAAAYEVALAATVPPAVVTANRIQLATLVATNFFGQNTAAIAATEVAYAEMWAQDAAAMFGYSASSTAAVDLTPFNQPPQTTKAGAPPPVSSSVMTAFDELNTVLKTGDVFSYTARTMALIGDFATEANLYGLQMSHVFGPPPIPATPTAAATAGPGQRAVLASTARARQAGRLSVPQSWPTATGPAGAAGAPTEAPKSSFRALPSWAAADPASGLAPAGRAVARPLRNTARRMQVRRYEMPRPAVGG
ncbi:MAG TPA: PPE family protein [Mycobacterium sp.]|nr:PPE family protein [Mycobacterium sp.]